MINITLLAIFILFVSIINHDVSMAMVIDVPVTLVPTVTPSTVSYPETARNASTHCHRQFRVRRTRTADLDVISTMLAMEAVPSREETWNWNNDMERLRAKSQFRQQLGHRLAAIEEGRETAIRLCDVLDSELEVVDTCGLLWQNDNLRSKIRAAVVHSQEENAWLFHNFDETPSSDMLNHAMIAVEEVSSGGVVGFCEVAWLPSPTSLVHSADYDIDPVLRNNYYVHRRIHVSGGSLKTQAALSSNCKIPTAQNYSCAPAIVNLVTSPSHRRMGIASRLINFASKYTKLQWRCSDNGRSTSLGLYVHPQNEAALKLYSLKGFSVLTSKVENGLLYLTQRRKLEDK